ncbi:MAG: hypothetical protein WC352_00210 [Candidatus Omnitrophota bacterium]|jgi:hypothetical protein
MKNESSWRPKNVSSKRAASLGALGPHGVFADLLVSEAALIVFPKPFLASRNLYAIEREVIW